MQVNNFGVVHTQVFIGWGPDPEGGDGHPDETAAAQDGKDGKE